MSNQQFMEPARLCLNDKSVLEIKLVDVYFKNNDAVGSTIYLCPNCGKYLGKNKMISNAKKAALNYIKSWAGAYENKKLKDIEKVVFFRLKPLS